MRFTALVCLLLALSGCSREMVERIYDVDYDTTNRFAKNLAPLPGQFTKDIAAMDRLINNFSGEIEHRWGSNDVLIASKRDYVKYTDGYLSRAHVDFTRGIVTVETVAKDDPQLHLRNAIITTLLTPYDPAGVDLFSARDVSLQGKPFLLGQVLDQDKKAIEWDWRANRFADYLIAHQLKKRQVGYQNAYYVEIPMVEGHSDMRGGQYASYIRQASRKYGIPEDLIYAIIKTESSFNPYAVSWANAYGLMQVVPKTAGRDVYKLVMNKPGEPTPEVLFNPAKNIDIGTAYFYILKTRYLKDVRHPLSKEYTMISAYNGGAGNVLRTFDANRTRAIEKINRLKPNQVYWALTQKHPKQEARRYLYKVTNFKKEFAAHGV
ncbi:Membrane-bound lytic murein transglycosylase C [Vibrio stylophorae]|uniref:Membrane-bound lytic murein transglycosylase C n=1 Tax=Vibrio stylophorae TaxID=659351 RepID=A0ABN8DRH2_9VIBR|nr:membrane-bound lytic murein transglycosylase MltC [Vibrio stylophorae]CAH0532586.1 Membrane-bound lytic murein transglycosylase C [Vibrio stylophorae]